MNVNKLDNQDLRYERKFHSGTVSPAQVEIFLKSNPLSFHKEFPDRMVNNIYLDTVHLDLHRYSIEGSPHRVKFRFRWYGDLLQEGATPVLEIKRKFGLVGDKLKWSLGKFDFNKEVSISNFTDQSIRDIISNQDVNDSFLISSFDLRPVLVNRYQRRYYISDDGRYRCTIDDNLTYYSIRSGKINVSSPIKNPSTIVEVKYHPKDEDGVTILTSNLPIRLSKISKYTYGVNKLLTNRLFFT